MKKAIFKKKLLSVADHLGVFALSCIVVFVLAMMGYIIMVSLLEGSAWGLYCGISLIGVCAMYITIRIYEEVDKENEEEELRKQRRRSNIDWE